MSATTIAPIEVVLTRPSGDDGVWHAVCHCTEDNIAACGLDCTDEPWTDGTEDKCPLCVLAWPYGAPTCPWGCDCENDCGPGWAED